MIKVARTVSLNDQHVIKILKIQLVSWSDKYLYICIYIHAYIQVCTCTDSYIQTKTDSFRLFPLHLLKLEELQQPTTDSVFRKNYPIEKFWAKCLLVKEIDKSMYFHYEFFFFFHFGLIYVVYWVCSLCFHSITRH